MIELYKMCKQDRDRLLYLSTHFNLHYNKTKKYEHVYNSLLLLVDKSCSKALWCVVTNIARALKQQAEYLQIPKDVHSYKGNKQGIGYRKMVRVLDVLCALDYLVFYKGGFVNLKNNEFVPSVYQLTDKFKQLWIGVDIEEELLYTGDVVEIKDRETKELKNSNIRGTASMRSLVQRYNKQLCEVVLTLDGDTLPVQQYKRVFSGSLEFGGRFYNTVGGVQIMKQQDRKRLMINGEKVVELDFKALHPSILYELAWQQDPSFVESWISLAWDGTYNPYTTKGYEEFLRLYNDEIAAHITKYELYSYNPIRNLFKFTVMACLNAKRGEKRPIMPAANAVIQEVFADKKREEKDRRYVGVHSLTKTFPAHALCELVVLANKPIEEHFFSDVGVWLQRVDSDIIEIVVQQLVDEGEVLYPEHDSVIVRAAKERHVVELMRKAYYDVIGSDQFCVVEKK